jgi:restriction system protein
MGRQKTSPIEDLIILSSKLPWWAGLTLALFSYLILHHYATLPPVTATGYAQLGDVAVRGLYKTLAMFGQYVLPFAFTLGALISALTLAKQKRLFSKVAKSSSVASLNQMSWGEFEHLVSEFYRRRGFQVTHNGGSGPDGGVDIVLRKKGETYLVQCKQWKAYKVGAQPVREFYGVMASRGVAGGYFVTSGEYTVEARRFAQGLNLELVDGHQLRRMIEVAQEPPQTDLPSTPPKEVPAVAERKLRLVQPRTAPSPVCPACTGEMVKRVASRGANARKEFWGCAAYLRCKGTLPILPSRAVDEPAEAPAEEATVPNCPHCGSELVIKKFMSGPKSGEEFQACLPCKKGWPLAEATR